MGLFYISLIFISLLTLHYTYFIGSIFVGLKKLYKSNQKLKLSNENAINQHFVTIVIPFRNEADVILNNLKSISKLNYPVDLFEVIYIDDNSNDDSFELLSNSIENKNINVVKLPGSGIDTANKKKAVEYGISLAKGDIIFASDADCMYEKEWISTMLNYYDSDTGFIAGPVDFETSNSLLSSIQQLEHAGLILTGAGLIGANNPIICSGANISFRKDVFNELNGYAGYLDFASGDDSFLMTKVFYESKYTVNFCFENRAMVKTRANKNINDFLNQRKRWVGKAFYYKNKKIILHIIFLALFLISLPVQFLFGLLISPLFLYTFAVAFLLKAIGEFMVMFRGTGSLYGKNIMKWFFITELIHIPYTVITVILGFFSNFNWKGNSLKR